MTSTQPTLSPSAAILSGSKLRPAGQTYFFDEVDGVIVSCPLGAAWEAATGTIEGVSREALEKLFPALLQEAECPARGCGRHYAPLYDLIIHLTEDLRRGRGRIAAWLKKKGH